MYEALWRAVASIGLIVALGSNASALAQSSRGTTPTATMPRVMNSFPLRNNPESTIPVVRGSGGGAIPSLQLNQRALTPPHLTSAQTMAVQRLVGAKPAAFTLTPHVPTLHGQAYLTGLHWGRFDPDEGGTGIILFGGGHYDSSLIVDMSVAAGTYLFDFAFAQIFFTTTEPQGCRYEIQLGTGPLQTIPCQLYSGQHVLVAVEKPAGEAFLRLYVRADSGDPYAVFQNVSVTPVP